jgi:protease-4
MRGLAAHPRNSFPPPSGGLGWGSAWHKLRQKSGVRYGGATPYSMPITFSKHLRYTPPPYMNKESIIIGFLLSLFVVSAGLSIVNRNAPLNTPAITATPGQDGIGILTIYGPIMFSEPADIWSSGQDADSIIGQIQELGENPHVKGILIRINSPGGTVGASQEIFNALQRVKTKRKIPIVASIADMGASGAYWVALASDDIFANPGSLVGSIGVLMQQWDLTDVKNRYGIGLITHKSGDYKDMMSGWRDNKPEEKAMINATLSEIHGQFRTTLAKARNLSPEKTIPLSQGQVFSGSQAQQLGLVDHLGGFEESLIYIGKRTTLGETPLLIYPGSSTMPRWLSQLKRQLGVHSLLPALTQNPLWTL